MADYKCMRCGFTTNHKNNFRKHLNRKFVCKPLLNDVTLEFIKCRTYVASIIGKSFGTKKINL